MVIQEARAEQEEPPAPGGRRGGGRKPLLPFMLCWALPASRSLRSTGRAEPLPLGAAGGGRAAASPSQTFGEAAAGPGGFLEMLLHFLPPRMAAPAFQGWARRSSFLPPSPSLPGSAEGEENRRGMTHPALPGLGGCGRGALSLCPARVPTQVETLQGFWGTLPAAPPHLCPGLAFAVCISLHGFLVPVWGCCPPHAGLGLTGGSSCSLPARSWGPRGCLGLGAGVTRGQASERGGNEAFSESSAFLRSSWETLAPSLRAPSPGTVQLSPPGPGRVPGDPWLRGLRGTQWSQPSRRGCPGPRGGAGWEGQGPPGVGGRAGGWVGRVCIGAGWFRRGGEGWQRRGGGC